MAAFLLGWVWLGSTLVSPGACGRPAGPEEFLAGSFVLTQQSLLEAPFR
jgi:hypothetical protein